LRCPRYPAAYLNSADLISEEFLQERNIKALLLDIDNTIVPRDSFIIPNELRAWIDDLKSKGYQICLLSNNWHKVVFQYGEDLGLPVIYKAMKPAPFAFLRALKHLGVSRREAIMVGDQLFTDILGSRLLGMRSVLVRPLAVTDLWYTLILRKLERLILGGREPEA
jgi:HAD superfamily phosphatase (TIGR01668 family)